MKKFYQIDEFFPAAGDQRFSLSEQSPLDQVTYNIFTADDFSDAAIYDYGERKCLFPETETPLSTFYSRFARWKAQRGKDIAAAFGAMRTAYKPLDNYSMSENHTGNDTLLHTPDGWKKESIQTPTNWTEQSTESYTGYKEKETFKPETKDTETESFLNYKERETQRPDGWVTESTELQGDNGSISQNKIVPFNGTDPELVSETVNENKSKNTEAQKGTFTTDREREGLKQIKTAHEGKEDRERSKEGLITHKRTQNGTFNTSEEQHGTMEDKTTYNSTLERSGNIGTVTSQMMAEQELKLREKQFIRDILAEFFNMISVYAPEV